MKFSFNLAEVHFQSQLFGSWFANAEVLQFMVRTLSDTRPPSFVYCFLPVLGGVVACSWKGAGIHRRETKANQHRGR